MKGVVKKIIIEIYQKEKISCIVKYIYDRGKMLKNKQYKTTKKEGKNMNLLFKLTDKDIGVEPKEINEYKLRIATRGIVIRDDGKIALQNKNNTNEFKLIGGGIENEEGIENAFKREVLEESGCEIEIIKKLGVTEEYISLKSTKQISHIFIAKVIKDLHILKLTEKEKIEGAQLIWETPEEALKLIKNSYEKLLSSNYAEEYNVYRMKFIILRDTKILQYYLENKNR